MPVALFGITNEGLNLAVNLIVLFLVVVWIALVVWTYLDARRRLDDPVLVASATAAALFPFVGSMVYSILRPPEYSADRRERELEIRAAELRVRQLEEQSCPNCGYPVERNYLRCPDCRARVKDPCDSCGKPIDPRWSVCPYCEAPVQRAAPPPRRATGGQRRAPARPQARPSARESARKPARPPSRPASRPASASRSAPADAKPTSAEGARPSRAPEPQPTRAPDSPPRRTPDPQPARARPSKPAGERPQPSGSA